MAAACRSDKRLELQLEGQAASDIEDEALPRRPAVQAAALYGFTYQKRVRASLPAHLPVSGSSSRCRIPALLRRQAEQLREDMTEWCRGSGRRSRPSKKFICWPCEKITQPRRRERAKRPPRERRVIPDRRRVLQRPF